MQQQPMRFPSGNFSQPPLNGARPMNVNMMNRNNPSMMNRNLGGNMPMQGQMGQNMQNQNMNQMLGQNVVNMQGQNMQGQNMQGQNMQGQNMVQMQNQLQGQMQQNSNMQGLNQGLSQNMQNQSLQNLQASLGMVSFNGMNQMSQMSGANQVSQLNNAMGSGQMNNNQMNVGMNGNQNSFIQNANRPSSIPATNLQMNANRSLPVGFPESFSNALTGSAGPKPSDFLLHTDDFPALGGAQGSGSALVSSGSSTPLNNTAPMNLQMQQLLLYQQLQQQQQMQLQLQYQAQQQQQQLLAALHAQNQAAASSPTQDNLDLSAVANSLPAVAAVNTKEVKANVTVSHTVGNFGLSGLLAVTRMTDPDFISLHLGTELSSLVYVSVLYPTFESPFNDIPLKKDQNHVLPTCYNIAPPMLKQSHLTRFLVETLFYIFYNMPRDQIQVFAAKELYNRGWKYHKQLQVWFKSENATASNVNAASALSYFDIQTWRIRAHQDTSRQTVMNFMTLEEIMSL